jgi:hypothetical protein
MWGGAMRCRVLGAFFRFLFRLLSLSSVSAQHNLLYPSIERLAPWFAPSPPKREILGNLAADVTTASAGSGDTVAALPYALIKRKEISYEYAL